MNKKSVFSAKNIKALGSIAVGVLFLSPLAHADIGESLVLCKRDKTVRTLRIEKGIDDKCKAIYTKQGLDQVMGSSQKSEACEEIVASIRKNLEEGGKWTCREVKEARVSKVNTNTEE